MLFYVLLSLPLFIFFCLVIVNIWYWIDNPDPIESKVLFSAGSSFIAGLFIFFLSIPSVKVWTEYAKVYSRVTAQEQIIEEYERQKEELQQTLETFDYPESNRGELLNADADSPIASTVDQLSRVQSELTQARNQRARAIRDIKSFEKGPVSGVVNFVGDPRDNE